MFRFIINTLILFVGLSSSVGAFELNTAAQMSNPKYAINEKGVMDGICVDIINSIQDLDPEIQITGHENFIPFKRLQKYLESGELDVFFGLKKTVERQRKYTFIDVPLYQMKYVLAVRFEDEVSRYKIDDLCNIHGMGTVLTLFGSASNKFLNNKGCVVVDDKGSTISLLLKKLLANRGRFVFYHELGLRSVIKKEDLKNKVRILPVEFSKYEHYVAFSKNTSPEIINRVRLALETLNENGQLMSIQKKYGLID